MAKIDSSLASTFGSLWERREKALILYVTGGDPSLEDLPAILETLQEGGADVIELGIPFSDPIADGPTIQASDQRALDRAVTPIAVLEALSKARIETPVVLMGYFNPVLRMGLSEFAAKAKKSGASGTIITDLTAEESDLWRESSKSAGLDTIMLAAPTSTDARLDEVCWRSSGFVYAVSRTGVTGALQSVPEEVDSLVRRIKARTELPVCVGFGISRPEHVRTICKVADGAVIGSWLVDLLHRTWDGGRGREETVKLLKEMKEATRQGL